LTGHLETLHLETVQEEVAELVQGGSIPGE
jgi:hypothetical protein